MCLTKCCTSLHARFWVTESFQDSPFILNHDTIVCNYRLFPSLSGLWAKSHRGAPSTGMLKIWQKPEKKEIGNCVTSLYTAVTNYAQCRCCSVKSLRPRAPPAPPAQEPQTVITQTDLRSLSQNILSVNNILYWRKAAADMLTTWDLPAAASHLIYDWGCVTSMATWSSAFNCLVTYCLKKSNYWISCTMWNSLKRKWLIHCRSQRMVASYSGRRQPYCQILQSMKKIIFIWLSRKEIQSVPPVAFVKAPWEPPNTQLYFFSLA